MSHMLVPSSIILCMWRFVNSLCFSRGWSTVSLTFTPYLFIFIFIHKSCWNVWLFSNTSEKKMKMWNSNIKISCVMAQFEFWSLKIYILCTGSCNNPFSTVTIQFTCGTFQVDSKNKYVTFLVLKEKKRCFFKSFKY